MERANITLFPRGRVTMNQKKLRTFVIHFCPGVLSMDNSIIDGSTATRIHSLLYKAEKIVITCHVSPDGDAIGSSLALSQVLKAMGKHVHVVTPDTPPRPLMFLKDADRIVVASRWTDKARTLIKSADLIFCLDFNSLARLDRLADAMREAECPKVMIDHHLEPEDWATVIISRPDMSSTCVLLYHLLVRLGFESRLDKDGAECIYTGMMTDTGHFTYNSNDPDIYIVIARLMSKGIDKNEIYRRVFNTHSLSSIRISSYALYRKMQILPEHKAALITLTGDELKEFGYEKGDTEGLVNVPLSIPGVVYSVFMREDEPDYVKISTRSVGEFPVNKLCERYFSGGGHLNAAGGEYHGSLSHAVSFYLSVAAEFDSYIGD